MRLVSRAAMLIACVCVGGSCRAEPDGTSQAWFYSTVKLRPSTDPEIWCSFVTEASAEAAVNSERFEPTESGWLRYRGNDIESLMVVSQSEDAYVEDTYTFGQDLSVTQVDRKGHYVDDPFAHATFKADSGGRLIMTDESRSALRSWEHTTYFLDWPFYATFSEIPFAGLIGMEPGISVLEACHETTR